MAQHILVLHGPNLNLLGTREPEIYGNHTLDSINQRMCAMAQDHNAKCEVFQSNSEGELVSRIQQAANDGTQFIIINAAAYTHTSVAIRDALSAVNIEFIEVHISNVYTREPFRHKSYLSDIAIGVIAGLGVFGYQAAMQYALDYKN